MSFNYLFCSYAHGHTTNLIFIILIPIAKKQKFGHVQEKKLEEAMQHRKLVDVAKSQAQDLAVLREEVEKLRAKTFPMFPSVRPPF